MLSAVAVTDGDRAAGLPAEQSAWKVTWVGGAGAVPSHWESWPLRKLHPVVGDSHCHLWICEHSRCSATFCSELAPTVLLSCAALMLVSRHTYGLQTLMGCLDLGRARSPSQM